MEALTSLPGGNKVDGLPPVSSELKSNTDAAHS